MAYIQKGMSINCRTEEELKVFTDIAVAEGHNWISGKAFNTDGYLIPVSFQIGFFEDCKFPDDISYTEDMNFTGYEDTNVLTLVEASQLFRNILISRRAKNGTN